LALSKICLSIELVKKTKGFKALGIVEIVSAKVIPSGFPSKKTSMITLNSQQYYLKSPKVNKNNASGLL
jgi:hypothetical protein